MERLFARRTERERRDELLSAYLDGELSAEERARLETQLATDAALRAELDALRHTVSLVRGLPSIPVPRNFILPQTAGASPRPAQRVRLRRAWAAPFLTAATAVVSLLFVVVLAGDLLFSGMGGLASTPAPERAMVEAPQEVPPPMSETEDVALEIEVTVAVEADAGEATFAATQPPLPLTLPTATFEGEAARYVVETPVEAEKIAEAPTVPATATAAPELMDTGVAESVPSGGIEATPHRVWEEETAPVEGGRGESEVRGAKLTTVSPWRALEVILGLTALGLALTTVRAWRIRRRSPPR